MKTLQHRGPSEFKTHYVQKAANSHLSGCDPLPVREVQCHENTIGQMVEGRHVDRICKAWYVKMENGTLAGQFHSESEADNYARTA